MRRWAFVAALTLRWKAHHPLRSRTQRIFILFIFASDTGKWFALRDRGMEECGSTQLYLADKNFPWAATPCCYRRSRVCLVATAAQTHPQPDWRIQAHTGIACCLTSRIVVRHLQCNGAINCRHGAFLSGWMGSLMWVQMGQAPFS